MKRRLLKKLGIFTRTTLQPSFYDFQQPQSQWEHNPPPLPGLSCWVLWMYWISQFAYVIHSRIYSLMNHGNCSLLCLLLWSADRTENYFKTPLEYSQNAWKLEFVLVRIPRWAKNHGVSSSSSYCESKVSNLTFPEDPKLLNKWLKIIKRESFQPTKHSRVCAVHFTRDNFKQNPAVRSL